MSGAEAEDAAAPNPWRGEAGVTVGGRLRVLRPTFAALVAAEVELGSLFGLVDRAAAGKLALGEVAGLFWHCLADRAGISREMVGEAVVRDGLAAISGPLRGLLTQILKGGG